MDPLSDVLSLLKPRNYLSAGLEAGGDWAIQFPDQQAAIKCGAVVSGRCWLSVEGVADAVRLDAGDCFLLPRGRPFRLASDLGLPTVDAAHDLLAGAQRRHHRPQWRRRFPAGQQPLRPVRRPCRHPVADAAAHRSHPARADHSALRWPVERMMQELRQRQPGGFLIVEHLAHMILIEALRLHLRGPKAVSAGCSR